MRITLGANALPLQFVDPRSSRTIDVGFAGGKPGFLELSNAAGEAVVFSLSLSSAISPLYDIRAFGSAPALHARRARLPCCPRRPTRATISVQSTAAGGSVIHLRRSRTRAYPRR